MARGLEISVLLKLYQTKNTFVMLMNLLKLIWAKFSMIIMTIIKHLNE